MPSRQDPDADSYRRPGWLARRVGNPLIATLTRYGVSIKGARVLEVPGRRTAEPRQVPVNVLVVDGRQHLVSPRGDGEWVRNVRANGGRLDLLAGRRRTRHVATEVADDAKPEILRAYLRRWKEVSGLFPGIDASSSDDELLAAAPRHPVFVLEDASSDAPSDADAPV